MRTVPAILLLLATVLTMVTSGCHGNLRRFGPPPPAYACDGYGCDGYDAYGGFSECVDDGQYYSRRDARRDRRAERRGDGHRGRHGRGPTYNGLPVVAAYIVPMEMMDGGDCMSCGDCMSGCCDGMSGDCMSCGDSYGGGGWQSCESCPSGGGMSSCGPNGCSYDREWRSHDAQPTPMEGYPQTYPYDGQIISPMPVPPAEEGDWTPGNQPVPRRTIPEPEARLPVQSTNWMPARLP